MVSAAVSITALIVLAQAFGLVGAGLASIIAGAAYSIGVMVAYKRVTGSSGADAGTGTGGPHPELDTRHRGAHYP